MNRSSSGNIIAELLATSLVQEVPYPDPGSSDGRGRRATGHRAGTQAGGRHVSSAQRSRSNTSPPCGWTCGSRCPNVGSNRLTAGRSRLALRSSVPSRRPSPGCRTRPWRWLRALAWPYRRRLTRQALCRLCPLAGLDFRGPAASGPQGGAFRLASRDRKRRKRVCLWGKLSPQSKAGVTLFLVLESGVGGGIIIDGKLFRGGHGLAGEIGRSMFATAPSWKGLLGRAHGAAVSQGFRDSRMPRSTASLDAVHYRANPT